MRVIPKSTQRALAAGGAGRTAKKEAPSPERRAAGKKRAAMLGIVLGNGCGYCCGAQALQGAGILGCAVLLDPDSSDIEQQAAQGCPIPDVYSAVYHGNRDEVSEEEIRALVPVILDDEPAELPAETGAEEEAETEPQPAQAKPASGRAGRGKGVS